MELVEYLQALRRNWVIIVALAVIALLAAFGTTKLLIPPDYSAQTSLYVNIDSATSQSTADLGSDRAYAQTEVASFVGLATSDRVLTPVINQLQLKESTSRLAKKVVAVSPVNTVIIRVTVSNQSAKRAAAIANAIGANVIATVQEISKPSSGLAQISVTTISLAKAPKEPDSPNMVKNLLIGLAVGLILGIVFALLRQLFDTRIRSKRDVERADSPAVLGVIARDSELATTHAAAMENPDGSVAESFRRLRTNLRPLESEQSSRAYVVSSAVAGEGVSSVSLNLAISIADTGASVVVVDANLRSPSLAEYLQLDDGPGLGDCLVGTAEAAKAIRRMPSTSLSVLAAGTRPGNPSELIGSTTMADILAELRANYDVVIVDAPPLLTRTDALVLSSLVESTLVVVGSEQINRAELRAALLAVEQAGGVARGIVLNFAGPRDVYTPILDTKRVIVDA
jgi:succinoglycan biosynthesis transport protein ExoP